MMSPPCDKLDRYVDGELGDDERQAFAEHLGACARCQMDLGEALQLRALEVGARATPMKSLHGRRRGAWAGIAAAAAAAAAMLAWYMTRPRVPEPARIATAAVRTIEGRTSYAPADRHRRYGVPRSATGAGETVPLSVLAELERRGDLHGVAAAFLARAPASVDVDADRALLVLEDGRTEEALVALDAVLAIRPGHAQAAWNRALALRDLGLSSSAAGAFAAVAAAGEPGWADEARERARALAADLGARRDAFARVVAAGPKLATDAGALDLADARRIPGLARLSFYDALRSARSQKDVLALLPLARALDDVAGGDELSRRVERIARSDFARRAPVAARYADLVAGRTLDATAAAAFLDAIRRAGADDILLGALIKASPDGRTVPPALLPELARLAAADGDRWFDLLRVEQEGHALGKAGEHARAEALLLPALRDCGGAAWSFRCARIALELGGSYLELLRLGDARRILSAGLGWARGGQEWGTELAFLPLLAETAAVSDDVGGGTLALVRAFIDEWVSRHPTCDYEVWGEKLLAMVRVNRLDLDGARAAMGRVEDLRPSCSGVPDDDQDAFVLAHLLRDRGTPGEIAALRGRIAALRATAARGRAALLDVTEGRLLIDREPDVARPLLRRAIELTRSARGDVDADKARGYAYSVLALDAARGQDWAEALRLLAEEQGTAVPDRCVLGVALEDARTLVVARGADGALAGQYADDRVRPGFDVARLVPERLRARLAGCDAVAVLARAPVHGRPGLLPPDTAWSYRSGGATGEAPPADRLVVIADVEPPAAAGLPRLGAWRSSAAPQALVSGAGATPARALAAMADAGFIEIHAHGLVNLAVSDASFLALSPEADGTFALTAADIRRRRLSGRPVVILGACHAGQAAAYHHRAWSLATAFIAAGARAVIASPSTIADDEAGAFFDALRERIQQGTAPAAALRDERLEWTRSHPSSDWVRDLVVFD
jgi:tetratricopeptide (TPR) repeat protein